MTITGKLGRGGINPFFDLLRRFFGVSFETRQSFECLKAGPFPASGIPAYLCTGPTAIRRPADQGIGVFIPNNDTELSKSMPGAELRSQSTP